MSRYTRRRFIGSIAAGLALGGLGPVTSASALTIYPRSSWATDRPAKGPLPEEDVRFLIVHHSASRNGHTPTEAPAILRSFYDFHTGPKRGWNDIAYNFLIDSGGGVWEGRSGSLDRPVAGDATGGNQGFSQLVCVIGDYDRAHPTEASLDSLVSLLAWLADRYRLDTTPGAEATFISRGSNRWPAGTEVTTPTITGHRTMSRTTCPGDNLDRYVTGALMAGVTAVRAGSTPSSSSSSSTTAKAGPLPAVEPGPTALAQPEPASSALAAEVPPQIAATTTLPPPAPGPTGSPVLFGAVVVAGAATGLAVWRARRMSR